MEAMGVINKKLHTKSLFSNVQMNARAYLFIFLICSVFNFSCKHAKQNYPKAHTANPAIDKARSLYGANPNERTIAHFDSVYASLPNASTYDRWTKYDVKFNYYYFFKGSFAEAKLYADSMLNLLKGNEKEFGIEYAHTLMENGDVLMAENRYAEAMQSYYDGSFFAQQNLDPCSSAQFNIQLGSAFYHQGNYLKGIFYLKKAIDEQSHCTDDIAAKEGRLALPGTRDFR